MKLFIKGISVILLSLAVLFTTTGFYVFEHYCMHTGAVETALSLDRIDCDHHGSGHSSNSQCEKGGCCKLISTFYKINSPFERSDTQKSVVIAVIHTLGLSSKGIENDTVIEDYHLNQNLKAPPLIRKQFLYLTQQLKLAPPAC